MYFFILGSHPNLSIAEIKGVLGEKIKFQQLSESVLLLESKDDLAEKLINRLAGVIKIGKIGKNKVLSVSQSPTSKKVLFGISVYDAGNTKIYSNLVKKRMKMGLEMKKELKNTGYKVRYVDSKEPELSSVIVKTNKLIESGAEIVLFATKDGVLEGKTLAVQDFRARSDRDYGRPARDAKSGMLPPKLARMMINISGIDPENSTLLDPFCGSGTVLMEAALLGFKKVIGSDVSEKAIKDSKTNLDWMNIKAELIQSAAKDLDKHLNKPVDLIVAETYLGPPLKGNENREQIEKNIDEIMEINRDSFETLSKLLKKEGKAVIAFPAFKTKTDLIRIPVKKMLEENFIITDAPLIYSRPDQKVVREIYTLKRK